MWRNLKRYDALKITKKFIVPGGSDSFIHSFPRKLLDVYCLLGNVNE